MSNASYLIVHKDHILRPQGINSGAEMASIFLARYLRKAGRRVVLAGMLDKGECSIDGVEYWDLKSSFDVQSILIRAREIGPYHLITAGRALPLFASLSEINCISRTLITHDRAGNDTGIKPEILCRVADHVLCVSHAQAKVFISAGADPAKVKVIHNGADLELFAPGNPEERNYKRLVFVGALIQDKGIHVLINSFARLKSEMPDILLDIYGSADLWGREKLFDEQEIEKQLPGIKFHGKTPQKIIAEAYRNAGICVIPSIWFDPFPLVSLEAQATGCPVVAFNVGGLGEGMLPGKTGVLLNEISEDALTKCLAELLRNPDQLKQMSKEALSFARKTFTWERVVEKVTSMCEIRDAASPKESIDNKGLIGFLSTWNQQCGLATYGKFLVTQLPVGTFMVLGEDVSQGLTAPDENFVERCWKRDSSDFSKLNATIKKHKIKLLHLNCQSRFFPEPAFAQFLQGLRAQGVKTLAHLHNTFTLDESLQYLVQNCDGVIVHSKESRLEAIANGANADTTFVLPHGVDVRPEKSAEECLELRKKHGLPLDKKIVTCFGFVQAHKGMEGMIEAVAHLSQRGVDVLGVIAGKSNDSDPSSGQYLAALKDFALKSGILDKVRFLDRFLDDEEVMEYLAASDVVMMNYRSNYFEASGACALAIGARATVAASIAPPFMCFGDAVFHITGGYPPPLALEILLCSAPVREEIRKRVNDYCEENCWQRIAEKLLSLYRKLGVEAASPALCSDTEEIHFLTGVYDLAADYPEYQDLVERGELAAKRGDYASAHELLNRARHISRFFEQALSARAAVYLAEGKQKEAKSLFQKALQHAPGDARSLSGLGLCNMEEGNIKEAYRCFIDALKAEPFHLFSINKLIACANSIGRFDELEQILKDYTAAHPEDMDMLYCLAGCFYKQGKSQVAAEMTEKILKTTPTHQGALELKQLLQKYRALEHVLHSPPLSKEKKATTHQEQIAQPEISK